MIMNYWDERYKRGGSSNTGKTDEGYRWIWSVIDSYLPVLRHVLDVGCGDLALWTGRECLDYTGLDLSPTIIERNRQHRPEWKFYVHDAVMPLPVRKDVVICTNLLFHITNETDYQEVIKNVAEATKEYLFIFTWRRNPYRSLRFILGNPSTALRYFMHRPGEFGPVPQKHRDLNIDCFGKKGLFLAGVHACPLYQGIGAMYVFRRHEGGQP